MTAGWIDQAAGRRLRAITPWNFPSSMITWQGLPRLPRAAPSSPPAGVPFSALALAELAIRAGFPPGVPNVVTGDARYRRRDDDKSHRSQAIVYGSTEVGRLPEAGRSTVKKIRPARGQRAVYCLRRR
jgi:acyl-CoA reductase-like NAD-dependent aldehyde dehydrogenase